MSKPIIRCHIDPALLEHAKIEAKAAGVSLSRFFENAVQQAVAKASADRAIRDTEARERAESHLPSRCLYCGGFGAYFVDDGLAYAWCHHCNGTGKHQPHPHLSFLALSHRWFRCSPVARYHATRGK